MGENSAIEWTDSTWNPVTSCSKVSPDVDLFERELQLRARAGQVMSELRAAGIDDWQATWRDHPVATAYRALLREAWTRPGPKGNA